jgi:hypothetical protein
MDLSSALSVTVKVKNKLFLETLEKIKEVANNFDINNRSDLIRLEMDIEYLRTLYTQREEAKSFVSFIEKNNEGMFQSTERTLY